MDYFFAGPENPKELLGATAQHPTTKYRVKDIAAQCHSVSELLKKIELTAEEREHLEQTTRSQGESELWHEAREGRLTASNFYRIHTRMNTLRQKPHIDMSKLIESILNPPELGFISHIAHGKQLEAEAVKAALNILGEQHTGITGRQCGLFIHPKEHYLGATPDHIVHCDCHGEALLEIKCPTKELTELTYLEHKQLKTKCNYFGQVQGQMAVTKISTTYFFVYKSKQEHVLITVHHDKKFCSDLVKNLDLFYSQYLAPKLLFATSAKKAKF